MYRKLIFFIVVMLLVCAGSTKAATMTAQWKFDGNANDAVGTNHLSTVGDPTYVDGHLGQALEFDANDYASAPADSAMSFGAGSFSVAFWIKRDSSGNFSVGPYPFYYGNKAQYQGFGMYGYAGTTNMYFYGHAYDVDTGIDLDDTNCHHIALAFDGIDLMAYKDGDLVSTNDRSSLNTVLGGDGLLLMSFNAGSQYFGGVMDDFRFYNRVLSATEITRLYESYF